VVGGNGAIIRTDQGSYLAPKIIKQIPDTSLCAGYTTQIDTDVIGDELNFQWYFMNQIIPGADSSSLIFDSIVPQQGGFYTFRASNEAGFEVSDPFLISVRPPAQVLASPWDTLTYENDTLVLNQSVTGALPIHYQWQKNGTDIPGANQHIYTIHGVQLADSGYYRCIISNDCGLDTTHQAKLTVLPASSVSDKENKNSLSLYPNPVKSNCRVEFHYLIERGNFTLYNFAGDIILSDFIHDAHFLEINTSKLASGVYFLSISTSGNTYSAKFIKE